jgi:AraC-like DNA-binding protein
MGFVQPGAEISREGTARHVGRHRHLAPYAAIVLRGGYAEAGDQGRFRVTAGHVLLHDRFDAHQNDFGTRGADILNLMLPWSPDFALGAIVDPDALAKLAERDPCLAAEMLRERLVPRFSDPADWPDLLASDLRADRVVRLDAWADAAGVAPSSLSRGFRKAYGVSPQLYRAEQRAIRAARKMRDRKASLAAIAADVGFADQPHMNRTIRRIFGQSPAKLGDHVYCVQDGISFAR